MSGKRRWASCPEPLAMPILRYAFEEGEVLRYRVEVTVLEPEQETGAELTIDLCLSVGPGGQLNGKARQILALGKLANDYKEQFLKPLNRRISPSGLCIDDPGNPSAPYLPRFLEESVEVGEGWGVPERGPEGANIEVDYRLESVVDGVAELSVRKETGPALAESVIRFSLEQGRVLESQTVTRVGDHLEMTIECKLANS